MIETVLKTCTYLFDTVKKYDTLFIIKLKFSKIKQYVRSERGVRPYSNGRRGSPRKSRSGVSAVRSSGRKTMHCGRRKGAD